VRTAEKLGLAVCCEASFEVISFLVNELGANVNQVDSTALTEAAENAQHDMIRYLIEELGADVNLADTTGCTPLYSVALRGQLDEVRILLNLGADINRPGMKGLTPLMIATYIQHQEVVKWLGKAGADTGAFIHNGPNATAATLSRDSGACHEQTAYLEAKTHYSNSSCSGAGLMKCTGCKEARYCGEACQLEHWNSDKADCRRWRAPSSHLKMAFETERQ
jgi:hypothetical protein